VGAVDGSFSRDCTVLAVATVEPRPHVWLERIWEAPEGRRDWRVPVVEAEDAILREDSRGARLSKKTKDSPRRIDAAVAAVMAVHRAAELAGGSRPDSYI